MTTWCGSSPYCHSSPAGWLSTVSVCQGHHCSALHILSVELLMVLFPFTKLSHAFTLWIARWYNGAIAGYKGVQS